MKKYENLTAAAYLLLLLLFLFIKDTEQQQQQCGGGLYYNATSARCLNCTGNTYCVGGCVEACVACPSKTMANANRTNCNSGSCQLCPLGFYCDGGTSIAGCMVGTYGSAEGLTNSGRCTNCLPGKFSPTYGLTACTACSPGKFLARSYFLNTNKQTPYSSIFGENRACNIIITAYVFTLSGQIIILVRST